MTGGGRVHLIGLISDTHGLMRDSALDAMEGVELIFHSGDVGGDEILDALGLIAPVEAVYGNTDPPGDPRLAGEVTRTIGGLSIHVSHGHELGSPTPGGLLRRYVSDIIVFGHTHRQIVHREGSRLVVNPGSAGRRRFDLRPSVARLTIAPSGASVELVELPD